ncbi:MAG: hypothetical protein ABIY70_12965 [Capsulimonas sp.]|uniref:hypothetical protein n=1 Tax=Capsulimonas sp. TaxID=2494211 RepID=UPI003266D1D8
MVRRVAANWNIPLLIQLKSSMIGERQVGMAQTVMGKVGSGKISNPGRVGMTVRGNYWRRQQAKSGNP